MAEQKLMEGIDTVQDREVKFYNLQRELSDDLDKSIDKIVETFSDDSNIIVSVLFLFMWSKFHHIYGVKGEKADTVYVRHHINKIIDGDIPPRSFTN